MDAEPLSDTLANVRAEALFHALADTKAEFEAEALYVMKPYKGVETRNEVLVYSQDHKFLQVQA